MNSRKAFTLIELLVVIAIIAILAAILFPVFAQAKLAAKKTSSLANVKEIGTAQFLYGADSDDYFVLADNADKTLGTSQTTQVTAGTAQTWVKLMQPYIKNYQIMIDPGVGDTKGIYTGGANTTVKNQQYYPEYAYNYLFLSPWDACVASQGRSMTAAVKPAETVMFTTSQAFSDSTYGYFRANAPGAWPVVQPAPNACAVWDGTAGSGNWSAKNATGKITGGARAVKPYGGANVLWVDGHAKYINDMALAAGTDYATASAGGSSDGAVITDMGKYLWSLDGTTNDLSF